MYYFASDVHLGLSVGSDTRARELLFVRWLEEVSADAEAIFLVGDIFDFWHEYRLAVPKGFTRLLGKLSELTDRGVAVHFFIGNHDMWAYDYLKSECGVTLHRTPYQIMELAGLRVCISHGDVLGRRSFRARMLAATFHARWLQTLFRWVHPDLGLRIGQLWSRSSRLKTPGPHTFGGEQEHIVRFARELLAEHPIDLFVCGHLHVAEIYRLSDHCTIAFLGEWMHNPSYGVLGPEGFQIKPYPHHR